VAPKNNSSLHRIRVATSSAQKLGYRPGICAARTTDHLAPYRLSPPRFTMQRPRVYGTCASAISALVFVRFDCIDLTAQHPSEYTMSNLLRISIGSGSSFTDLVCKSANHFFRKAGGMKLNMIDAHDRTWIFDVDLNISLASQRMVGQQLLWHYKIYHTEQCS